ncbi:MAG: tetratricopeptide repeat protein [Candidatus Marinimicrobia bacterium]|nr:tetratricopeptide repeat protein [Candidatus Neomarinimicrobiota bacterium]
MFLSKWFGIVLLITWLLSLAPGQITPERLAARQADSQFKLAMQLEQAGNSSQAQAIYSDLVTRFPGNAKFYLRHKRLLRTSGQYLELLTVLEAHLLSYPDDIQTHVEVGEAYLSLGRSADALAAWEAVLDRFAGNTTAERLVLSRLFTSDLAEEGRAVLARLRQAKGDSGFFALDMGRLYAARLNYDQATDEFLRHLENQPRALPNVSNQLLRFPQEPEMLAMLREKLSGHGTSMALSILAKVEFRYRRFDQVVELHRLLETPHRERLALALDLVDEQEYVLAQELMQGILADERARPLHEQTLMELAGVFLTRSQLQRESLVLSGFYPANRFFSLPFIHVAEPQLEPLRQAMALYDSLVSTWHNPRARLQLAGIKYRILDDFDGALLDLQAALSSRQARAIQTEIYLRMVDVLVARGDLGAAERALQDGLKRAKTKEQLTQVELKTVELLFLSGHRDSLGVHVGGLLATIGPADPAFNDLLELAGLVGRFGDQPREYQALVACERLVHRNRRSEAINILSAALVNEYTPVSPILQYRLAHLHALQAEFKVAEMLAMTISGESEFTEQGLLLAAEIADYLVRDSSLASARYLAFMDNYTLSIHHDTVRRRYRVLNPEGN